MLRRMLIGTALVLGMVLPALAAADDAIQAIEKEWGAAVVAHDYAKLDRILSDDLIYAHSTGNVESKQEYVQRLRSGAQKYDAIEYENITVHLYGETAVAHSHLTMRGTSNGKPFNDRLMMMNVWVNRGGHWQLVAHQTTKLH